MTVPPTNLWTEPRANGQFTLRTLGEGMTICCIAAAAAPFHLLLAGAISFGLLALWAIRIVQWRVQFSLVMLFGGLSAATLGCFLIIEGFRLIPLLLREHWLPDIMIALGPICGILGGFCAIFGLAHLVLQWADELPA